MKVFLTTCFSLVTIASCLAAIEVMLPTDREVVELKSNERNPYVGQSLAVPATDAEETITEETRIRRVLSVLKVGGVSGSGENTRVLLGPLILKKETKLPPFFRNQIEELYVSAISSGTIEVSFRENDPQTEPRRVFISLNMTPRNQMLLVGEAVEILIPPSAESNSGIPNMEFGGANLFLQGTKEADFQNIVNPQTDMMGNTRHAEPDSTKR